MNSSCRRSDGPVLNNWPEAIPNSFFARHPSRNAGQLAAFIVGNPMRNTRNNPLEVGEGILDLRPVTGDHEFADALVMPGATHLEHIQSPSHLTANLHVLQEEDRVGDRGDVGIGDRMAAHELL